MFIFTVLPGWYKGQKRECDRCGLTFYIDELTIENGFYVCEECLDEPGFNK